MSSSKWGNPFGWALLAASCKAAAPADPSPPIAPAPDLPTVASKEAPQPMPGDPARASATPATEAPTDAARAMVASGSGAVAADDAGDIECAKHTFCDVLQLFARAERGESKARAVLEREVAPRDCVYDSGDVSAEHCGRVAGFPDGCDIGFSGKVDDAQRRKHVVRAGTLPANARDIGAAPAYRLPKVPIEARAIRSAIAACLPDFSADSLPDPMPVEGKTYPPLWMPVAHGLFFVESAGSPRRRAELKWSVLNAEVLEHADEIQSSDQPVWAYSFVFVEPTDAAGAVDR